MALKSPWGHLGSLVDVRNRLHRIRCRFQHISANSLINAAHKTMNSLAIDSRALVGLHRWPMRYRQLPTTRPTPRGLQEPIWPRKKCVIWTRWRLVSVKNVNYPRAPSSRRSGLAGSQRAPLSTSVTVHSAWMDSTTNKRIKTNINSGVV